MALKKGNIMSNFVRTVVGDRFQTEVKETSSENEIEYIRWKYNNELYVGSWVSFAQLKNGVCEEDISKIQENLGNSNACYWYAKVIDLKKGTIPESLSLYTDTKDGILTISISKDPRTVKGWFNIFKDLLEQTPVQFDKGNGNIYGRFDNSAKTPERYFVLKDKQNKERAIVFFNKANNSNEIHNKYQVAELQPLDSQLVSMCQYFEVYGNLSQEQLIKNLETAIVTQTHNDLFNEKYIQKTAKRILHATVTPETVKAWNGTQRNPTQDQVMNKQSATKVAKSLKLPDEFSYEWLHLFAYSFGPSNDENSPQKINNLILGTSAANTQMLMHEALIKNRTLYRGNNVKLTVVVDCIKIDEEKFTTWLVKDIWYDYKVMNQNDCLYSETTNFNPFQMTTPTFIEYKLFNELQVFPDTSRKRELSVDPDTSEIEANKRKQVAMKSNMVTPLKENYGQLSKALNYKEADLTIWGISFDKIKPCVIVNNEYQPRNRPTTLSTNNLMTKPPSPEANYPDGNALKAQTSLLDQNELTADLAILNNGIKQATIPLPIDNFTFDNLFRNFDCDNVDLFVLSDVSVHLQQSPTESSTDNSILFSGTLNMDNNYLSVIKNFLKIENGLLISGEIDINEQDLTTKLEPEFIILTSAANFYRPITEAVVLKSAALQLSIQRKFDFVAMKKGWTCSPFLTGKIEISNIAPDAVELNCIVSYINNTLHIESSCTDVTNLFNINGFILDELQLKVDIGLQNDVQMLASFTPSYRSYEFGGILTTTYAGIYASATEFTLNDLSDIFSNITGKQALLPDFDVTFDDVLIGVASADCTIGSVNLQQGLTLMCQLTVHGYQCAATVLITKDGISFTGSLGQIDVGPVRLKQATLKMSIYSEESGKPTEFAITSDAVIEDVEVLCQVSYEKIQETWNCVLYAGIEAKSFGVSTVFPLTKGSFVDTLKFSKIAFIYSTQNCTTQNLEYGFTVYQGLQLVGLLEEIPELTSLTGNKNVGLVFSAHFGTSTDITIAMPDTRLNLGGSVTCDPFTIRIFLTPEPSFQLIFGLDVCIPKQHDTLHFDFALDINAIEATGSATMKNWWQNPFGIQGLKIGPEVALQVGIIYDQFVTTGTPSEFGIAGGLAIGTIEAAMAVNISEDPTHEILMGKLNELSLKDLVAFAETITELKIDEDAMPNFFEFRDVELYCAPSGGMIGTITYQPGFSFSGDLTLFEKRVAVYTLFSEIGVEAKGEFDKIDIGPLKITGENGKNATLNLELTNEKQLIHIDGAFEFLDRSAGIYVDISTQGIHFEFEEQFVGLMKYKLKGDSQGTITNPASLDFTLTSEFDNNLSEYLKNTLSLKIHDAINTVETKLEDAQKSVNDAEKIYRALYNPAKEKLDKAQADADEFLKECQKKVNQEKEKYTKALEQAKSDLASARKIYDDTFKSAKDVVINTQAKYDAAMRAAQDAVTQAQASYDAAMKSAEVATNSAKNSYDNAFNSAAGTVCSARNSVNSLQNQIDNAVYKLKHLKWYQSYKAPGLAAKITGLEVAMRTAQAVLYTAEGVLKSVKTGSDYTAWQDAIRALETVRDGGKYTALETAKTTLQTVQAGVDYGALQSAQQTLKAIQEGSEYTTWLAAEQTLNNVEKGGQDAFTLAEQTLKNIGQSIVYITLQTAKVSLEAIKQSSAAVAFESASAVLEGVKKGSKAMLNLAEYISKYTGDLINVKKVTLSSHLKAIEKGDLFNVLLNVSIFDQDCNWTVQFNVNDVKGFIEALFKKALDEAIRCL